MVGAGGPAGLDPAACRDPALGPAITAQRFDEFVEQHFDPALDVQDQAEPEICKILGGREDASMSLPGGETKVNASQRFAGRHAPGQVASRGLTSLRALHLAHALPWLLPCVHPA